MLTSRRTLQENPCMNCEYRDIHCHCSCNAYKKWRLKDQFIKHKIDKTRKDDIGCKVEKENLQKLYEECSE